MKKTLLIATAATLSLSISSAIAGDIEKAERYSAPLEVVEMEVSAVETGDVDALAETEFGLLGSNAEVQELGGRWRSIRWSRRWVKSDNNCPCSGNAVSLDFTLDF